VLDDLVRLCVELDRHRRGDPGAGPGTGAGSSTGDGDGDGDGDGGQPAPAADTTQAWEALERAVIGKTTNFLLHSVLPSELQ
jgi:hypothetical protein